MTLTEFEAIQAELKPHVDAIRKVVDGGDGILSFHIAFYGTSVNLNNSGLEMVESVTHTRRGIHRKAQINGWEVAAIAPEPEEIEVVR